MIRLYRLIVLVLTIISCQTTVETQLPDVKANLFKAGTIDLQVATQNKVTLLTIWSIFCGPCLKELPELQTVYDRYKLNKRVTVLTLALNTNQELNRFLSTSDSADIYRKIFVHSGLKQLTLPILVGTTSPYQIENGSARLSDTKAADHLKRIFKFDAIPTTRIYDQGGKLIFEQKGVETSALGLRRYRLNLIKKLDSLATHH
ncbi:TlpA family protein disulfide reductase [Spirosoma linguale]|uniref:Alkyl hydroperoxide reductase/ Thiol specific antioxidant/ Mal allergen n=1 Tax=Spirosoma linguale (strain ATCC 33905 / DSM 74 / LMG 10896 / Claus 1) TaxID=504472 RepID=D2QUS1_SPILD|nr:alkyl hydroperoxide reductase/ Thiol specific antioxidant/ Mal allergen [Spirosoma linguale DSM 74]